MKYTYTVVACGILRDLLVDVNTLLASGWKLQGGIAVAETDSTRYFYQALHREEE